MVTYANKGERWTEAEEDFLRQHYNTTFAKFLSTRMGRPVGAIRVRAYELGLTNSRRPRPPRRPSASLACKLTNGSEVIHRVLKNEYTVTGPVFKRKNGMWIGVERTLCYRNPRAPLYRMQIKVDSLVLVSEYRKWYAEIHAGAKAPPKSKERVREEIIQRAIQDRESNARIRSRRAA